MQKNQQNNFYSSGAVLYAKTPGITSFSSLWNIKHALATEKVGHTGTLDSFADGLLVVLCGSLTHLVPHITAFTKTYRAVVCFGKETDTLDPSGKITKKMTAPSRTDVEKILPKFTGTLLQIPPVYSALHVNGKRASDIARSGKSVELEPRQVFIYENKLLDFKEASEESECSYALLEIKCSKGTYIRALARDMAVALDSCAFLSALRRTEVGPFKLEDAANFSNLKPFTIENAIENENYFQSMRKKIIADQASPKKTAKNQQKREFTDEEKKIFTDVRRHYMSFTPELAFKCGFEASFLKKDFEKQYLNGRPLCGKMFSRIDCPLEYKNLPYKAEGEIAVFYSDLSFAGMIKICVQEVQKKLSYSFVVPHENFMQKMRIFTWQDLLSGEFPIEWQQKGTALSVGSFDGMHKGHLALIDAVLEQKNLVHGIVTFRNSIKAAKSNFEGNIDSFYQRVNFFRSKKLDFLVVIDFSDDFSRIRGSDFIEFLVNLCAMKFIAEGTDFCFGYKAAFSVEDLKTLSEKNNFVFQQIDDVLFEGKKISSSRIRKCVLEGDFSSVQKMLLRPFSYDAFALDFTEKKTPLKSKNATSDSEMSWFGADLNNSASSESSLQVLPPDGNYKVVLDFEENKKSSETGFITLHTLCNLETKDESRTLSLLLPSQNTASRVKTINFIPAE